MQIPQQIRALIGDPAPLHRAQDRHIAAFAEWRSAPDIAAVFDSFAAFAGGAALSALPPLAALFEASGSGALGFARSMCAALLPALAAQPLGQIPVRHQSSRATTRLMLARSDDATLTLMLLDGAALAGQPPAGSAPFAPAEEWDVVLAGNARGRLAERRRTGTPLIHPLDLHPGVALGRDAAGEALLVDSAEPALVFLRLQRRRPGPEPTLEIDLASGEELHRAAASPRESRQEMAVTLLGRMGRKDAAPLLAELAREQARGDSLRWQSLRECLGLDTHAGFRTLAHIARDAGDPLSVPAGALRARLVEQYPVLAEIDPCPA